MTFLMLSLQWGVTATLRRSNQRRKHCV